jgi:hypothetical protein
MYIKQCENLVLWRNPKEELQINAGTGQPGDLAAGFQRPFRIRQAIQSKGDAFRAAATAFLVTGLDRLQ